jgi:CHAD domain-containing protein
MTAELKTISFKKKSERSMLTFFSKLSNHYFKTIHDLLAISIEPKQWKSRHALRIAIRKWRYILEIFAVVLDRDYDLLLKQLKKYQLVLGRINDVTTFGALCKDMELTHAELKLVETTLLKEEKILLKNLTKLIKQKPLITSTGFITLPRLRQHGNK